LLFTTPAEWVIQSSLQIKKYWKRGLIKTQTFLAGCIARDEGIIYRENLTHSCILAFTVLQAHSPYK